MQDQQQTYVKMGLDAWNAMLKRTDKVINAINNDQLMQEVAPGRNTGEYLLGHLTAVNDGMLSILGLEDKHYPEMEDVYLRTPDKSGKQMLSATALRERWQASVNRLNEHFGKMQAADWFGRHMSVSEEDFAKEPHRNKLNVLIGRTIHLSEHYGQLLFLVQK